MNGIHFRDWQTMAASENTKPVFKQEHGLNGEEFCIQSAGFFKRAGAWVGRIYIQGGLSYTISSQYQCENVAFEDVSVVMQIGWLNEKGEMSHRDYIHHREKLGDGWNKLMRTLKAPDGAVVAHVYLYLRWSDEGSVRWTNIEMSPIAGNEVKSQRKIRITTTHLCETEPTNMEDNLQRMLDMLDQIQADQPDLVCMTECYLDQQCFPELEQLESRAQPIPSPFTNALAAKAKSMSCYLVFAMYEQDLDGIYNTAVLMDRNGDIVGKYRKTHITTSEVDMGVTPGRELPVYELDFGCVGILTCWDAWFSEPARVLALKGAEIICIPINGDGVPNHSSIVWPARAMDNGVYMVFSTLYSGSPSQIIAPDGKIRASIEGLNEFQTIEIDLEERNTIVPHLTMGLAAGEGKVVYRTERRPDLYSELSRREL